MTLPHNIGVRVEPPQQDEPRLHRHVWALYDGKVAMAVWGYDREDVNKLLAELRGTLTRVAEMAEAGAHSHDIHEVATKAITESLRAL